MSDWIRQFQPRPEAAVRLVCFPHAGGSATYFFPVARALPASVDVLAVQYPGRQDRRAEPCIDDIGVLADTLLPHLRRELDRPVAFFGHSMGASLAFEVARRLEAEGTPPTMLFVSGRRAPSRHRDERAHRGTDAQLVATIKSLAGTDAKLLDDPEVLAMVLPAIRSDYRAAETYRYRPGPPLTCPIVALTGDADPQVTEDEAADWAAHTAGPFALKVYPGGHFYLDAHAAKVIALIAGHLADAVRTG